MASSSKSSSSSTRASVSSARSSVAADEWIGLEIYAPTQRENGEDLPITEVKEYHIYINGIKYVQVADKETVIFYPPTPFKVTDVVTILAVDTNDVMSDEIFVEMGDQ